MDPDAAEPKKYIRTFEGDIQSLGRGEVPNLVPLQEQKPTPAAVPAPAPAPAPMPTPAPATKPTPLQTYEGDFLDRVKDTKASTLSVLAAEQDSAPLTVQTQVSSKEISRSNLLYGIASGLLLIAGGIGAYIAYTKYLSASAPVVLAPTVTAPIFVDDRQQVSGTGTVLVEAIEKSVAHSLAPRTVRLLYLDVATTASTSSPQATTSVFSALQTPAPGVLLRNVNAAQSMAGVVNAGGETSPFFILSVASYGETFAGMLFWEPLMPRDLAALFPLYPAPVAPVATTTPSKTTATASTSSSQATASAPAPRSAFYDDVVANHDVRAYRDAAGRTILLYGYWNQTTLIIARSAAAFTEIVGRLATSRAQP